MLKSLVFGTPEGGEPHLPKVRFGSLADVDPPTANCPLQPQERTLGLGMSALRGEADEDQRPPERPLIAKSGPKDEC